MEKATEVSEREGLMEILASGEKTKQIILARLAWDDAFWDDLEKSYGPRPRPRPVRRDDAEPETSWTKMDHLATPSQKAQAAGLLAAAAAWLEDEEEDEDDPEREALRYRKRWNYLWSQYFGSFEDTTTIPPMRYTDEPLVETIYPCHSLQVFSAKIAGIEGGFRWPIDVFGLVAIRDSVDQNRNIIFQRSRVECQTLTEKDPYLVLTGPTRAVVLSDSVTIEVYLKVKGPTEHEDETLCFLAEEILCSIPAHSSMLRRICTSKFSTLEFTFGHIIFSVEATISVRVDDGSWPDGFHGQFSACTNGEAVHPTSGTTSVNDKKIILLSFGDEKVPVIGDGMIELSRRVVSVPVNMKLEVSVKAWQDDSNAVEAVEEFTAKKADRSFGTLDIGYCKMDVIVAWSLISNDPEPR